MLLAVYRFPSGEIFCLFGPFLVAINRPRGSMAAGKRRVCVVTLVFIVTGKNTQCTRDDLLTNTKFTPVPAVTTTPAFGGEYDCNFQDGVCDWVKIFHGDDDEFRWRRTTGNELSEEKLSGPTSDRNGEKDKYFLYVNANHSDHGVMSEIRSPKIEGDAEGRGICFRFYLMTVNEIALNHQMPNAQ